MTTLRTILAGAALALFCGLSAQNSNVVNAYNYLKDGELAKAVEYIEPAIAHEATSAKEKTWRYRGDIYRQIALGDDETLRSQFPGSMKIAIDSYLKAKELDTKESYKIEITQNLGALQSASLNQGNAAFGQKDFQRAIELYGNSEQIAAAFGQIDTNAIFNSALAYESAGDAPKAIERYQKCLELGFNKADVYRYLASLQRKNGDLDGAINTTKAGRKTHPENKDLVIDEMSFLLEAGRSEEAETSVQAALANDPDNAVLYSVLGSLYDAKANPKEGEAPPEEVMKEWSGKAEEAYKMSIEKDPDFFDAYFNIGVLYNNRAAFEYEKIKDIKSDSEYMKAKKAADDIYLNAVPYFEKAHNLKPDDVQTIQQLMKLYAKTSDQAKYDEMKAKLGN
ncbi:MAG: tetratricopeptide repeat protein [Flavobacteriales bacterium]|nr:tetratricopeptide repeat protein [Flavobacteriales bacterium]